MAWIELHQELRCHPKIVRLAARLEVSPAEATGNVVNLWLWAVSYAKDGNIAGFTPMEVRMACDSSRDNILEALIETGWIDVRGDKKMLHDWKKHGLRLLQSNQERVRKHRETKRLRDGGETLQSVTVTPTNLTNHTNLTNQTKPKDGGVFSTTVFDGNDVVASAWETFREHRREIRKRMTPRSEKMLVRELVRLSGGDPGTAVEIINKSIANGWQGLFELKGTNGTSNAGQGKRGNSQLDRAEFSHTPERLAGIKSIEESINERRRERGERSGTPGG